MRGRLRRRPGFGRVATQSARDGRGGKGEKVGKFLQIEEHTAPAALTSENVLLVGTRWVFVVVEWNEVVASGTRHGGKSRGHVRDYFPASGELFRAFRKTNDYTKKGRGGFLLCAAYQFRPVHKERPAFIVGHCGNGALWPRILNWLKKDLKQAKLCLPKPVEGGKKGSKQI